MEQSRAIFERLADAVFSAENAEDVGARFFASTQSLGAISLQTRVYRRPTTPLTSATHWQAGGIVSRIAKRGWVGSGGFNYICFDQNPLLTAIRENRTRYRFSNFAPHAMREYGPYWEALSEAGIEDGLCATSYGDGGKIASLHLGMARRDFAPGEAEAIQSAGLMLTEKLIDLIDPPTVEYAALTTREFDAMRFVAEGKTDWEIGVILSISESTARFHIDNARRKLGAASRAQAVAKLAVQRQI